MYGWDITTFVFWKKRPPYWNFTSGFDFYFLVPPCLAFNHRGSESWPRREQVCSNICAAEPVLSFPLWRHSIDDVVNSSCSRSSCLSLSWNHSLHDFLLQARAPFPHNMRSFLAVMSSSSFRSVSAFPILIHLFFFLSTRLLEFSRVLLFQMQRSVFHHYSLVSSFNIRIQQSSLITLQIGLLWLFYTVSQKSSHLWTLCNFIKP